MPRPEQKLLTLVGGAQAMNESAARELLAKLRFVDLNHAPKRASLLAELPGCRSESHLSEALKGDKNFPIRWLPPYVRYDRDHLIAGEIARWSACKVLPQRPRSKAERLARLEQALESLGDIGDLVRRKAEALSDSLFETDLGED